MALHVFKNTYSCRQRTFYKTVTLFVTLCYWMFGLLSFTNNYRIYLVLVMLWCCEIILTTYWAIISEVFGDEETLNGLVSIFLYVTHVVGHIIVLIESCGMFKCRVVLFNHYSNITHRVKAKLKERLNPDYSAFRINTLVIRIFLLLGFGHGIVMWATFNTKSAANLLYWSSLQGYLALQLKTLEVLTGLLHLNYHTISIRQALNDMGERNLRRVYKKFNKISKLNHIYVVPLSQEKQDEELLELLKRVYFEVYATLKVYNQAYGWSLLSSTIVNFVDFVCRCYWILLAVLNQDREYYYILQNTSFALMAFILLVVLCWYCEECHHESLYIGCLVSKLAKPLGNKHYNDLVSEFSVQALHQRFTITAKEFFSLNLNLLGRMVAAIVTYLVILIQFMFTENSKSTNFNVAKTDQTK